MKKDIYKKIATTLNRRHGGIAFHIKVKLMTVQETIDLLAYLESLEEPVEYIEETLVKKLDLVKL